MGLIRVQVTSLPCIVRARSPYYTLSAVIFNTLMLLAGAASVNGVQPTTSLTHGWECISCPANSMLAGNLGHTTTGSFNLSDPWWVKDVASHYAAVSLNQWGDSKNYNGTGANNTEVEVGRALKAANPKIKILFYQALDRGDDTRYGQRIIHAHPEWWLKNDNGQIIWFDNNKKRPVLDLRVKDAQEWFAHLPLSYYKDSQDARENCDGLFFDSASYENHYERHNFSQKSYDELFLGRMETMRLAQETFTAMNEGEVWANPAPATWHSAPTWYHGPFWNLTLQYINGGFDPWFGSFALLDKDGTWNASMMAIAFENIINASNAGHSMILHAFPGPATSPFTNRGKGKDNDFRVASWNGNTSVPANADSVRRVTADLLVQTLAPFLIVANENVFLSYAWFWNIEDGYIPCRADVECGMPSTWYPEFSKPLGAPRAPASRSGTVWTRQFEHASVYVDLADRTKCKIDWMEL